MAQLYHYPLCPHSRFIRLALGEFGIRPDLIEERPFERRPEFLALNPAGQTPVLVEQSGAVIPGAGPIAEYLDETRGLALGDRRLLPESPAARVEVRRLLDWFNVKFYGEVSNWLVTEKIYKRFMRPEQGGGGPEMELVRAARTNIRYHLRYIGYLARQRNWLAGDTLSYADLAAAALNVLAWEITLPKDSINVKVEHGWVTLEGRVDWQFVRGNAERAVRNLIGVTGVSNHITVTPHVVAGDVNDKIRKTFVRSAEIDANRVIVETSNDTVKLYGSVHSWTEHDDASRAAYSVPGVTKVENHTLVSI